MRNLVGLLTVLILACCLVCCVGNSANETGAGRDDDSTALRVAVLPTMECLPFYAANRMGVFDSLGLSVRLVTFDAAMDADTAFQNGHVDALATDLVKAALWRSTGDSVRVALSADLCVYLVTARQARLKSGASLKEKIIAFTRNSALDYTADGMLALAGLGSEQLNKPQINNLALRTQMLMNYQYDGALLPEPWATKALADGNNLVYSTLNLKHYNPLFALVLHDSTYNGRNAEVKLLTKAYDIAVGHIARGDSADAARWMSYLPLPDTWPDSIVVQPVLHPSSRPSTAVVDSVKSWLRGRALFQTDFKYSDLIQ